METKNHALKYGLIGGLLLVAISLLMDLLGFSDPANRGTNWLVTVISIAVFVWALFTAIRSERADRGGAINFGGAFKVAFTTTLIIAVISAIYMFVYVSFINPDIMEQAREMAMENLASQGFSDEMIEEQMAMMENMMSPAMMTLWGFLGNLIMGIIISLIGAAVLKKESNEGAALDA